MRQLARFGATVGSALSVIACATLNPYVGPGGSSFGGQNDTLAPGAYAGRLPASRKTAEGLEESYRKAIGEAASVKNGLAIGLPLLNAGALFGAATGQSRHSNFIPAVGFGTAGLLSAGGLTLAPSRADIYNNGREALACAVEQSDPYLVKSADYNAYLDTNGEIYSQLAEVQQALARVDAISPNDLTDEMRIYVASARAQAASALDAGGATINRLAAYRGRVDGAPGKLDRLTRQISVAVDRKIGPTEATWQQIRDQLGASALASTRAGAPPAINEPATPPETPKAHAGKIGVKAKYDAELEATNLANSAMRLAQATARANAFLTTAETREAEVAAETCAVGAAPDMRLINKSNPDRLARGGTISFALFDRGGEGRGGVPRVPDPGDGITAEVLAKGGANYVIRLAASSTAALGARNVAIQSGNGFEQIEVAFNLVEAPAPAGPAAYPAAAPGGVPAQPAAGPPAQPAPPIGAPIWLSASRQAVLAYGAQSGGSDWREILEAYAKAHGLASPWDAKDATMPAADVTKLMDDVTKLAKTSRDQGGGDLSPFELWWLEAHAKSGGEPRVTLLQHKLGASGAELTGVMDARTRALIKGANRGDEHLTEAFVKQLFN